MDRCFYIFFYDIMSSDCIYFFKRVLKFMAQKIISIDNIDFIYKLFGSFDENINFLKKKCCVDVVLRSDKLMIFGDICDVEIAKNILEYMLKNIANGKEYDLKGVEYAIDYIKNFADKSKDDSFLKAIGKDNKGNIIYTKTVTQKLYVQLIKDNVITFGVGPAGTGKTYIAVVQALQYLKEKIVDRIIITRPVVQAGKVLVFCRAIFKAR